MRKIAFKGTNEAGTARGATALEWPTHWSEKEAVDWAARIYVETVAKIAENYT